MQKLKNIKLIDERDFEHMHGEYDLLLGLKPEVSLVILLELTSSEIASNIQNPSYLNFLYNSQLPA